MFFSNGLLQAKPDQKFKIFHFQTREVGRRSAKRSRPEWLYNHYTACKADDQPIAKLESYMEAADLTEPEKERLRGELAGSPLIPSIVVLALRGAGDERESSWDFGVGDSPKEYLGGKLPIVQCNLEIPLWYTWNAGQSVKDFLRHSPGKSWTNIDGNLVWDGDSFCWPIPGGNTNPWGIGIENELYGRVELDKDAKTGAWKLDKVYFDPDGRGSYPRFEVTKRIESVGLYDDLPGKKGSGGWYEKPRDLAVSALHNLMLAICVEYKIPVERIIDHRRIRPDNRTDAEPPFSLEACREFVRKGLAEIGKLPR